MKRKNFAKRFSCGLLAGALVFQGIPLTTVNAAEGNVDSEVGETVQTVLRTEEQPFGENVALGKKVYVGPGEKAGTTSNVTDGNTGSGWQDSKNKADNEWCVVDLGQEYVIDKLNVFQDAVVTGTYQMYVADENTVFDGTNFDSDTWTALGEEQTNATEDNYTFPQTKVRYIGYQSVTNTTTWGVQIKEIEAYTVGSTVTEKLLGTNIAFGKEVTAPENDGKDDKGNDLFAEEAKNMVDGDADTQWISYGSGVTDSWFILDLGENNENEYDMVWLQTKDRYAEEYTISVAEEIEKENPKSSKWEPVYEKKGASGKYQECMLDKVHKERYIMFKASDVFYDTQLSFSEIGVLKREEIVPKNLYLDYDKITLNIAYDSQKTKQLQTAVNPSNAENQDITWESSDTKVVEVSEDGLVTALAAGTATVTATITTKDTEVKASCEVEVINDTIDAPTEVTADHNEAEGQVTITWTNVAKAVSYEVYCIKEGETAKKIGKVLAGTTSYTVNDDPTSGGNYTYFVRAISSIGAKADSQPSNMVEILTELTAIKLKKTSLIMRVNGTAELSVTTTPAEHVKPYELIWEVENEDIVTVENGTITAKAVGTTTIKVSVMDREDIPPEVCTVTVKEALKEYEAAPLPEDHVYGKNVALGKEVTALVGDMYREKQYLVDGNTNTNFQLPKPEEMQQADLKQYYIIDLGQEYVIDTVNIFWESACASEYQIQVAEETDGGMPAVDDPEAPDEGMPAVDDPEAPDEDVPDEDVPAVDDPEVPDEDVSAVDDPEVPDEDVPAVDDPEAPDEDIPAVDDSWKTVAVEDDYQTEGSREEKEHTFTPIKARYVKLNCSKAAKDFFFNIFEIEVYTAGRENIAVTENIAKGAKIQEESKIESIKTDATKLIDGNFDSYWRPANESAGKEYFILDLGEVKKFNMVRLIPATNIDRWAKVYTLSVLNDNEKWETVYQEKNGEYAEKYCMFDNVKARYLKFQCKGVNVDDGYSIALAEIEIYNSTGIETKGITVGPGIMTLTDYEPTKNITAVVNPINADKRTVVYKSDDPTIASVGEKTGAVTGLAPGKTTVTVTVDDTDISAKITVIVKKAIAKVTNVKASMKNKTDHDVTITWDTLDTAKSYTVQRVSQEKIETVAEGLTDNTYTDTDVPSGTYTYQIVAMPIDEEYSIFSISEMSDEVVVPVDVASVAAEDITVKIGDTEKFAVTVTPKDATYPNVTYSVSDNDIIAINEENGTVTGLKEGTIEVTVTATDYPAISDTCTVTVEKVPVTGITLVSEDIKDNTLGLDEEGTLTAVIAPENASYKGVTWTSSDPEVADVSETGKVTPGKIGTVTITAISDDDNTITATYKISVIQKKVQEVTLDIQEKTLVIDESFDLTATVKPDTAVDKAVEWTSSDPKVAEVNAAGKVTAIAEGTADITVTTKDGEKTATCKVKVEKPAATGVVLNQTKVELEIGKITVLTATVTPSNADQTIIFKSENPDIATVDAKGIITAVSEGTTDITVTTKDGEITATCKIEVKKPAATGVTLYPTNVELEVGETTVLTATVTPSQADQTVLFTPEEESIATVDANGIVTAVAEGTTYIKAIASNGKTAVCKVTVTKEEAPVTTPDVTEEVTITLDSQSGEVKVGETVTVKATVTPEGTTVDWNSSNEEIATVKNGVIKGVAKGTATITATAGNKNATYIVTVKDENVEKPDENEDAQVTAIVLSQSDAALKVGETVILTATIEPTDAVDKTITWKSSDDSVATVNDGVILAVAEGTATITATAVNGVTAECIVTVTNDIQNVEGNQPINPVEQLTVSKVSVAAESRPYGIKTIYLNKKAKLKLKATVTGSVGIDTKVSYTTSDKSIASVSSSGQIKAGKKTGTAVITVASVFDPTKTATITVKVVEKATPNKVLKLKKTKLSLKAKGEQAQIQIKKYTKTTADTVSYKVISGKKYVKVDKYGVITSKANPGKKALTAKVQVTCGSKQVVVTITIPKKK